MSIYYEKNRNKKRNNVYGGGLFDSILNSLTSNAAKQIIQDASKQIATKTITETGNRVAQKALNKIIPPRSGKGLTNNSKEIFKKYGIVPIEQYVKK